MISFVRRTRPSATLRLRHYPLLRKQSCPLHIAVVSRTAQTRHHEQQHFHSTTSSTGGHRSMMIAAATAGLMAYTYRRQTSSTMKSGEDDSTCSTTVPRPSEEFIHPYNGISRLERFIFMCRRYAYLTWLFLPCAAGGILGYLTKSESIRQWFIQRMVRSFELAGCSFQKFGQWVSMRPDMFPRDLVEAMSKLQMDAPEHAFCHTRQTIENSLGFQIDDVFETFDENAIASGTVGQVYRAVVRPEMSKELGLSDGETGAEVAVKVRHPSVLDETFVDLDIIFDAIRGCDWLGIMASPFSKSTFIHVIQKQLNFEWEAHALGQFYDNFQAEMSRGEVSFPRVVPELLSESVLVESWANGNTIANVMAEVGQDFKEIVSDVDDVIKEKRHALAENIFGICMKMFLRDNLMHGDLHAGNILTRDDGSMTLIDAGFTTALDDAHKPAFGSFMSGLIGNNPTAIVDSLVTFNEGEPANVEGLRRDVKEICDRFIAPDGRGHDGRPVCIGDIVGQILFKLPANNCRLSGDVASSLVSIAISEGVIRQLDPEFDMNLRALPFLAQYGMRMGIPA